MAEQALIMPKVGESVTEGTVLRWLKQEGESVEVDEAVVEVETEKVNVEIPSPWAGTLRITVQEGDKVKVEEPLAFINVAEAAASEKKPAERSKAVAQTAGTRAATAAPATAGESGGNGSRATRYSPAVLNLARDHNIDLSLLKGSGLLGRITRKDVLAYIEQGGAASAAAAAEAPRAPEPAPKAGAAPGGVEGELIPLTPMRRTIAEHMVRSVQAIPHVWLMMEADVSGLVAMRQQRKDEFKTREDVELTYLPFAIKATVESLKDHPRLNSTWTDEGILLKKQLNIGVAVATDEGLVVPVIHHADDLSIAGTARRLADLAERARARKLRIEDVEGGTFTVDNTGAFGSIVSVPIINHPQAAILTMEAIVPRAVVRGDGIAVRQMVNLCLSFDHRILDGAEAGAFLSSVKSRLEAFGPETALF